MSSNCWGLLVKAKQANDFRILARFPFDSTFEIWMYCLLIKKYTHRDLKIYIPYAVITSIVLTKYYMS